MWGTKGVGPCRHQHEVDHGPPYYVYLLLGSLAVTNLKPGVGTRLAKSLSQGQLGVFSSSAVVGTRATGPVEMKNSDIDTICASIRAANPRVDLTCEANSIVQANIVPNDTQYGALYGMTKISAVSLGYIDGINERHGRGG